MNKITSYKNYGYKIRQDTEQQHETPRDRCNLGTMVCWHPKYNLGDWKHTKENYPRVVDFDDFLADTLLWNVFILGLHLYDHSGITISTEPFHGRAQHAVWDSDQVGYIFVSHNDAKTEFGWKRFSSSRIRNIYKQLRDEVRVYDQHLTGDVWYFEITNPKGEIIDSCGNWYGYTDAEEACKSIIDSDIENEETRIASLWATAFPKVDPRTRSYKEIVI